MEFLAFIPPPEYAIPRLRSVERMDKDHGAMAIRPPYPVDTLYENAAQMNGKSSGCCDGGAAKSCASFGFVIHGLDGTKVVSGLGQADGHNPNSFRAEAFGLAAILSCWALLRQMRSLPDTATISIWCDSKSLVDTCNRLFWMKHPQVNRNGKEADILACVISAGIECKKTFTINWVQSHQDRNEGGLTAEARMNVDADALATEALSIATPTPIPALRSPARVTLIVNSRGVTNSHRRTVIRAHSQKAIIIG